MNWRWSKCECWRCSKDNSSSNNSNSKNVSEIPVGRNRRYRRTRARRCETDCALDIETSLGFTEGSGIFVAAVAVVVAVQVCIR